MPFDTAQTQPTVGEITRHPCYRCGSERSTGPARALCNLCRREYAKGWRARRREEGRPVESGSKRWSPEARTAFGARYYAREDVRARRSAQMKSYASAHHTSEHHAARRAAWNAIKTGKLVRQPCEVCGAVRVDAHHDDYQKPLDVRWLCRAHHIEHHETLKAQQSATLRPGERLVAGKPYTFNADLLALHLAHEAVLASVGADLTGWSWDDLTRLLYACRTVRNVRRGNGGLPYDLHWDDADALATRAADARAALADRVAA